MSVLFVDVRGFTGLSERLPPAELVTRLNHFYDLASRTVFDLDGTLDKMVGDQVMAFFGAPFPVKDHERRAIRAALDIVAGVEAMAEGGDSLRVGGGVGTGEVFMGNVAQGEVRDFTVIGDVVNTASRLQGAAGPGKVLVMEETYQPVAAQFPDATRRTVELRGQDGAGGGAGAAGLMTQDADISGPLTVVWCLDPSPAPCIVGAPAYCPAKGEY